MKDKRTRVALILVLTSVAVNLALAFIKLFVGLRTNSLCIMLDSMNGFFDTLTGVVTAIAFGLTAVRRTEKSPYGLGRSEYVASFIVSVAATVMGGVFLMDSLNRLAMPEPVWFGWNSFTIILATVPVKLAMAIVFLLFAKKYRSGALKAIAADGFLDVGITSATVVSFVVSMRVGYAVDAIFGIAISAVVIGVSVKMIVDALRSLVRGERAFTEERESLIRACREEPSVLTIEDMRFHDYGYRATQGVAVVTFEKTATDGERESAAARIASRVREETGAEILVTRK